MIGLLTDRSFKKRARWLIRDQPKLLQPPFGSGLKLEPREREEAGLFLA